MATDTVPYGRKTQRDSPVSDLHIVWITAGLGGDGDSVSITAATQPSIEDVLLGAIPGLPKVHLYNPVLAYENGEEFIKSWHAAANGQLDPFVLVIEGSIPNETIKKEGYWAAVGTDVATGQPITTCEWIDRLAPRSAPPDVAVRRHGPRRLRPRSLIRAGRFRRRLQLAALPGEAWLLGAGRQLQRAQAWMDGRYRWLSERRRHLHRLHHAGIPGQVHALHGRTARGAPLDRCDRRLRHRDPRAQ